MHVYNTEYFGKVMMPLEKQYNLIHEQEHFDYVKLEAQSEFILKKTEICILHNLLIFTTWLLDSLLFTNPIIRRFLSKFSSWNDSSGAWPLTREK